jgi:catechol 2,3-dioxygenase-like lactoylglutathione lyase family enzyme
MRVLGIRWVGVRADSYDEMVGFLRDILGLRVAFEDDATAELAWRTTTASRSWARATATTSFSARAATVPFRFSKSTTSRRPAQSSSPPESR